MDKKEKIYDEIRGYISELPVIDCHEHVRGWKFASQYTEPIASLILGYVQSDLKSVGVEEKQLAFLNDSVVCTEDKWPIFERLWRKIEFTGYARVTKLIMKKVYDENEMSIAALNRIGEKILDLRTKENYRNILEKAGIKCRLTNIPYQYESINCEIRDFLEGKFALDDYDRITIPIIMFHSCVGKEEARWAVGSIVDREINSLDNYVDACREIFIRMKNKGAVAMKDQSAYSRILLYGNPTKAEAEKLFNFILEDPRRCLGWPQAKPLDDYIFNRFLEIAEDLDLPVQIHTGTHGRDKK